MATQDFTTYTLVNPNGTLSATTSRMTATNATDQEVAYGYKSFGSGFFTGNFTHTFAFQATLLTDNGLVMWAMANSLGTEHDLRDVGSEIDCEFYDNGVGDYRIGLYETISGGHQFGAGIVISLNTTYYVTITRVGTTLTLNVYSDSGRTTPISGSPKTMTLGSAVAYQYIYGIQGTDYGHAAKLDSGYIENLDLGLATNNGNFLVFM